jgi:hypothetical protein
MIRQHSELPAETADELGHARGGPGPDDEVSRVVLAAEEVVGGAALEEAEVVREVERDAGEEEGREEDEDGPWVQRCELERCVCVRRWTDR